MANFIMPMMMLGNKILDSTFGQGFLSLLQDGITVGQIIGGFIVVVIFIVVCIKKSNEEEGQGRKKYTAWQISLVMILVLILGAQEILNLVLSYFGLELKG